MIKMIPPVPTSAVMMPTPKQKIGFSIESIVGNDATPSTNLTSSTGQQSVMGKNDNHNQQSRHDIQDIITRLHNSTNNTTIMPNDTNDSVIRMGHLRGSYSPVSSLPGGCMSPDEQVSMKRPRSHSPPPQPQQQSTQPPQQQSPTLCMNKGPIVVPGMPPGLVRPFPVAPPNMPDIKTLPPYIGSPEMIPPQHNPHLLAAAQFQMAAALQGHVLGPAGGIPPHSPFLGNPGMPRDSYPLYPWLLSRHGRIFPHRFPGNFLLQPFRKPKRIRTAFSPSQLLKLEHAFESNQYVVGAERKALAQSLNLSETQVKVWFQNRRTKHKRMQQEDEKGPSSNGQPSSPSKNSSNISGDEEDDELIDMEMDDCPSDEEVDTSH